VKSCDGFPNSVTLSSYEPPSDIRASFFGLNI